MLSPRKCLPWTVVALLALFVGVFSAQPARAESTEEAVCLGDEQTADPGAALICNQSFCADEDHCWAACPSAQSVACIGGICRYTQQPGGGGGGPSCPMSFCSDDFHCSCKEAQGYCGTDNICHYD
ncbi:hypothetical protein [Myxococcus qinghaiensis]|uniref:hypothetical protein n=1 Tax=Myxococcus qinghaiensis TaxID=2906758 RepID=UPI0020A7CB7F|nr:hypothetical protein [Myxococcus qinghaiensis]MCP3162818.1 hypothetical protein [Myxococcus qinghaiensis]